MTPRKRTASGASASEGRRTSKAPKLWRYTAGEYPATYTVEERVPGGVLYERAWDPDATRTVKGKKVAGAQVRRSLGHRDREKARLHAEAQAKKLREGLAVLAAPASIGSMLRLYLQHRTPVKKKAQHAADLRAARMWLRVLDLGEITVEERGGEQYVRVTGGSRLVSTIGTAEWETFKALRGSGEIDADGHRVRDAKKRRAVGERTVAADLQFLVAVFNWACGWNNLDGTHLLERNPWGAPAPGVRRSLQLPKNPAPKRPVASHDRFLRVRAVADQVMMQARKGEAGARKVLKGTGTYGRRKSPGPIHVWRKPSYLPELLDLVEDTGRRIGAVLQLHHDDLRWGMVEEELHGRRVERQGVVALRWRTFKGSKEQLVPVSPKTRSVLEAITRRRPGHGAHPLFPSIQDPARPITRTAADEWLHQAETLADVDPFDGGRWHPYRRKWATERKHLPLRDVAEIGGWKDPEVLRDVYQQVDADTLHQVLNAPARLRETTSKEKKA